MIYPRFVRRTAAALLTAVIVAPAVWAAGYSELAAAIRAGDEAQVSQLLQSGVDASTADKAADGAAGAAPLLIAASRGKHAIARRLLAAGAMPDPRFAAYYDATPLMLAVNNHDAEMSSLLLDGGAQINAVDSNGDPALNWAAYYGDLPLVELLLARGADPRLVGHGNALEVAMRRGHQAVVERLLDHQKLRRALTPVEAEAEAAIDHDDAGALRAAMARGAPASLIDSTGRPALSRAARGGRLATLRVLLDANAPVNATDALGFTALFEAARDGQVAAARLLLDRGAAVGHVAQRNGLNLTALHAAASTAQAEVIGLLIERGAPLNARDVEGATALGWAINAEDTQAALVLVRSGADPDIAATGADSPRQIASERKLSALLAVMRP